MGVPVEGTVTAGGITKVVTFKIQRANNATQYTALDVVGSLAELGPFVLPNCARVPGGTGIIYSALMMDSVDAATNPNFSLTLFDTNVITVAADNATGTTTDTDILSCVGGMIFDGTNSANILTVGANLIVKATGLGIAFKCADGQTSLWGVVNDIGGYTPAALEVFTFKLFILQD